MSKRDTLRQFAEAAIAVGEKRPPVGDWVLSAYELGERLQRETNQEPPSLRIALSAREILGYIKRHQPMRTMPAMLSTKQLKTVAGRGLVEWKFPEGTVTKEWKDAHGFPRSAVHSLNHQGGWVLTEAGREALKEVKP